MSTTEQMLETYPAGLGGIDKSRLAEGIDACVDCAQVCTACADACLSEDMIDELRKCIRTCLDCADMCGTTGRVLSRHTGYDANISRAVLQACITACQSCADECAQHAEMHDHCRICAEACRACGEACGQLLDSLG